MEEIFEGDFLMTVDYRNGDGGRCGIQIRSGIASAAELSCASAVDFEAAERCEIQVLSGDGEQREEELGKFFTAAKKMLEM